MGTGRNKISILLVEDNPVTRQCLALILGRTFPGVRLLLAEDGEEALEIFRHERLDLVVSDVEMPVVDGIQMATRMKASGFYGYFIMLTAGADADFPPDSLAVTLGPWLPKPIVLQDLIATVHAMLDRIQREGERRTAA